MTAYVQKTMTAYVTKLPGTGADGAAEAEAAGAHPCGPQAGEHHAGRPSSPALQVPTNGFQILPNI